MKFLEAKPYKLVLLFLQSASIILAMIWILGKLLLLTCLSLGSLGSEQVLKGFHFQDNLIDSRFGPENGYATFNTGNPIPDQVTQIYYFTLLTFEFKMSICFKVNLEYDRYGGQNGMFELFRLNEKKPSVTFLGRHFLNIT